MTIRKLASIKKIDSIKEHTNADALELAIIGGWQVVVKKDEFKVGDLCIFCEIDSILPPKPEFEFLKERNYRIKTIKLRGELSQGLILPLSVLDRCDQIQIAYDADASLLDIDVTEKMSVTKYEKMDTEVGSPSAKGSYPPFLPKTDEQRLQSAMSLLNEMEGEECYITVKEDGSSFTAYLNDGVFGICSRNLERHLDGNTWANIAKQYSLEEKLREFEQNIAIQGEVTGDGIQGNRLELPKNTQQLHIFNIYNIDKARYLNYDVFMLTVQQLGLTAVEIIYRGPFKFTLEQLLEMSKGKYTGTNNHREGIVVRPCYEKFSEKLRGRLSFKIINNEYLLKEK